MKRYLEAGRIVNTHGVRGEVKIQPWTNDAAFLCGFRSLRIHDRTVRVLAARVHKGCVIASLEGVDDMEAALSLKGSLVYIDREEAPLDEGEVFLQDIVGLRAVSLDTGEELGTVSEVMELPAQNVYVIRGEREILVPAVPEFIRGIDLEAGTITVALSEGML